MAIHVKEMNRRQRKGWLGLVVPLLLVGTLLIANSVRAEENQATIAAFEALLSLPQTQPPEGGWDYSPPPGFVVEENNEEQVLISWLKKQKKMGADLNAVRHGGTMLHHAIRARMVDTVSWLLANGANPLKTVERDALELAIAYPQEEIFKILVKRPALVDPRRDGLYRAWKAVLPEGIQGKLWMFVPQTHRLALLQLGYRPSSEELRWWIDRNTPELIHAFWPKILSIRPEIGRNSHELLFQPVAEGSVYYCLDRWSIEKALPLTSNALPPTRPYAMEAGCWYPARPADHPPNHASDINSMPE